MYISLWENYRGHPDNISFMQFSTKMDGFEQKDSQGFENSYNSYEQYPLEKFFIFTINQNYTLALILHRCNDSGKDHVRVPPVNGAMHALLNAGGLLRSLDLSLGGVVGGSPVQCSEVFINTSIRQGGFGGCLSVGGPYAESIGELAWMAMLGADGCIR